MVVLRLLLSILLHEHSTLNHKEVRDSHFNIISTINQPHHKEVNGP